MLLEVVISDYQQGSTPEEISSISTFSNFPTWYLVIGYYLQHQAEVDAYIRHVEQEGERIRAKWESEYPPLTKAELLARLETKHRQSEEK